MPSTWLGSVPQVICGSRLLQSSTCSRSNAAPSSDLSVRQCASARSHSAPCGAKGRPAIQENVLSSGATKPERPPISMLRLHSVMRLSIGIARTAAPAYSTTWPRAPATPSSAMMRSATSLAVTCGPSRPSRRISMRFGRRSAITCVARMCASSVVPQPKASAPRPPTVLAWLSGTAWVAPGSTMPSSGATTWEMPCSGSSMSKSLMPLRRLPSRIALRNAAPDGLVLSSRPGLVATVWSCMEKVRSGRRTGPVLLLQLFEGVRAHAARAARAGRYRSDRGRRRAAPPDARPRSCRTASRAWRETPDVDAGLMGGAAASRAGVTKMSRATGLDGKSISQREKDTPPDQHPGVTLKSGFHGRSRPA